jgi:lambda family phage tail tape measure protein
MADNTVRIIVGLKDDFSRGISRVTNSLEDMRRRVFSLQSALAVFAGGAVLKGFVDTAAQMDKTLVLLKRLEGSSESARASFNWMLDFGRNNASVATINEFQNAFVKLKVAGLDPAKGSLQDLTDAVAAFGGGADDLQKATIAVFQMAGKGSINMEELRQQLGERIPTAIKIMARELNISEAQLNKLTETASITGDRTRIALEALFRGFRKDYGGAAKDLSTTWEGMINQLRVKWELFKIKVMDSGPFQKMKEALQEFIRWLDSPDGMRKTEEVANNIAQAFLDMAKAALAAARNMGEITGAIKDLIAKWQEIPQGLRDFIVAGATATFVTKNPAIGIATGLGYSLDSARERYVAENFPQAAPNNSSGTYIRRKIEKPGSGGFSPDALRIATGQMDALDAQRNSNLQAWNLNKPYHFDASKWGVNTDKAAKQAAAALEQFRQAVREVNKEFAEIQGDQSAVWLAEWEDRFQDLHTRIMKGSNGAEREAALERLKAADQATRAAITAGYKTMVEAKEDVDKFKRELAAFDTDNPREDDRLKMEERLRRLVELGRQNAQFGITEAEAERYRALQNAAWQKELDNQNLETKRSFYNEYIQIAGEGFAVIEDSILQQAKVFRNAKISEEHIAQWVEYQKLEYSREWADGAKRALHEYALSASDAAKNVQNVMTMAFQGIEDAVVQFVKTGKIEFADLVTNINAEIARLAFRSMASQAYDWLGGLLKTGLSMAGSYFSGGASVAAGSSGGGFNFAGEMSSFFSRNAKGGVYNSPSLSAYSGGIYNSPQLFAFAKGAGVFAEAGPEAIMPLKRRPDGSLGVQAEGGGETVALLREIASAIKAQRGTKVVNAIGKGAIANELSGGEGEQVILNHIRRNPSAIRRMLGL